MGKKVCILRIPKNSDLGITKNYRGIFRSSIASKGLWCSASQSYQTCSLELLRENRNGFRRNQITTSQILTIYRILEGFPAKSSRQHYYRFDSKHKGKMEQILLVYGLPKQTVTTIMMLYRNTKIMVRSPDRGTYFLVIVAEGDKFTQNLL